MRHNHGSLQKYRLATIFALAAIVTLALSPNAFAQTYTLLHQFTGGLDGGYPYAGLTMDAAGNFYGTTCGAPCWSGNNAGTVFRLSRRGSGWVLTTLYIFRGGNDGAGPTSRVVFGPDGSLYGTTTYGGNGCGGGDGCGTVFNLKPPPSIPPSVIGGWTETVLHRFQGGADGAYPQIGDVVFDAAGNLYGTTYQGGPDNYGTVFQLQRSSGGWTENILHSFSGGSDGNGPMGTLVFDGHGNIIGTTSIGNNVFQLTPSGLGWTLTTLYRLQGSDGNDLIAGVLLDYGSMVVSSASEGTYGGGTIFIMNNQMFRAYPPGGGGVSGPWVAPTGRATDMYGTTYADGSHQYGSVFHLEGCAGWGYNSIHDFAGGQDGEYPISSLVIDGQNNLVGTTSLGGSYGAGVVFGITLPSDRPSQCSSRN